MLKYLQIMTFAIAALKGGAAYAAESKTPACQIHLEWGPENPSDCSRGTIKNLECKGNCLLSGTWFNGQWQQRTIKDITLPRCQQYRTQYTGNCERMSVYRHLRK